MTSTDLNRRSIVSRGTPAGSSRADLTSRLPRARPSDRPLQVPLREPTGGLPALAPAADESSRRCPSPTSGGAGRGTPTGTRRGTAAGTGAGQGCRPRSCRRGARRPRTTAMKAPPADDRSGRPADGQNKSGRPHGTDADRRSRRPIPGRHTCTLRFAQGRHPCRLPGKARAPIPAPRTEQHFPHRCTNGAGLLIGRRRPPEVLPFAAGFEAHRRAVPRRPRGVKGRCEPPLRCGSRSG